MKLIKPSFSIIEQKPGMQGILEIIEIAARNCYKSEANIKYDEHGNSLTAEKFVDKVINQLHHRSVAEHGAIYLDFDDEWDRAAKYMANHYSKVSSTNGHMYVSTNYRVIIENDWQDDLKYMCEPTKYHEKRVTVKVTSNLHFYKDLTRHRDGSFSIESTRYCDYSNNKFGNNVVFISPVWTSLEEGYYGMDYATSMLVQEGKPMISEGYIYYNNPNLSDQEILDLEVINNEYTPFIRSLFENEQAYFKLIQSGWKPQQAAEVLPQAIKADVIMTGFISTWEYIFSLRCDKAAHPEVQRIMIPLREEFAKRNLIIP